MSLQQYLKADGINRQVVSAANPLPVSATVSATASIVAFAPTGNAVRSLSTTSARVALGSAGPTALVTNTGSVVAYIKFGDVTVVAATTDTPIQPGQSIAFDVGTATYIAGITASSTSALTITTGTGLPAIAGGGAAGSSGTQYAEDAAHASGDLGTMALGVRKDTAATLEGADGDYSPLLTDANGRLHVAPAAVASAYADGWDLTQGLKADAAWTTGAGSVISLLKAIAGQAISAAASLVNLVPRATANGATSSRINSAASNNLTSLKASAGNIIAIDVFNSAAYTVFLKIYNKASAPVVASDTPVWTIPIAAGTGFSRDFAYGKSFATGIAYAIVKLQADTDSTNVVALDLTGSIDWI